MGGVAGAGGPSGDGGDVDQVSAAVAELVEEHFGCGHRAEQVELDHPSRLLTLPAAERAEEHHASVVDQDICATEVLLAAATTA